MQSNMTHTTLFLALIVGSTCCLVRYVDKTWFLLLGVMLLGYMHYTEHPVNKHLLEEGQRVQLQGRIVASREGLYGTTLTLNHVTVQRNTQKHGIGIKVNCDINKEKVYHVGDWISVEGSVEEMPRQMNPSDMNYTAYLKSQGIGMQVKAHHTVRLKQDINSIHAVRTSVEQRLQVLFDGKDKGIMAKLLIGTDDTLDSEVADIYYTAGIGHVLAISGLHIGVIFISLWGMLGLLKVGYKKRILSCLGCIWLYALLIGGGVSAVRACIILTVTYIGRYLYQEEDVGINIAVAAALVLLHNPYQLFQVGFQLSFAAYISIVIIGQVASMFRRMGQIRQYHTVLYGSNILLTLCISPILAWHFFEVPIIASLLNFIVIPIYTLLVPLGIMLIGISGVIPSVGYGMAQVIILVLQGVEIIAGWVLTWPLATWVVGRPSLIGIALFYCLSACVLVCYINGKFKQILLGISGVLIGIYAYQSVQTRQLLEIAHLYIGQGDATVVLTPDEQVILIDGGIPGKEETIERYLHYKGYDSVDCAIVSHPHEDHIGGIIGLIENKVPIDTVLMPAMDTPNEWADTLRDQCMQKGIMYQELYGGERLVIGEVALHMMTIDKWQADLNDTSLVCLLTYGVFEELFTGDITKNVEGFYAPHLPKVDVLKVAHHGSKTSTADNFLKRTTPKYGIISCGINNRHKHPHGEVVERLESYGTQVMRTDLQGAVVLQTDGKKLSMVSR